MIRAITMTAYRRPAYTREVLAALAKCEGIADWILLPNVEPGHEEVITAFREWKASEVRLLVNRERLGLNRNTHDALFRAYQLRADVIVHLEDDTVPSPDALRYYDWAVRELLVPEVKSADGHQILLASGYNKPKSEPLPEQSHACQTRSIWSPWGWAVDRRRLVWLIANWCSRNKKCFTCQFRANYRRTRREVFPLLSRIQNIGYEMGENGRSPAWYRANHRTPWVASELTVDTFWFSSNSGPHTA
jgi:cellulose synthase/poly-beta-1,6-N-acetylglucosamine synthase-like glycosyltransferase